MIVTPYFVIQSGKPNTKRIIAFQETMSDCRCFNAYADYRDYISVPVGIDMTNQRFGEVSVNTCKLCGTRWLFYFVEYEAFTGSGRWFRGLISEPEPTNITPQTAVAYLERLPWYFVGGSYFHSTGQRSSGKVYVDL